VLIDPESFGGPVNIAAVSAQFTASAIPNYVIRKDDLMEQVLGKAVPLRRAV